MLNPLFRRLYHISAPAVSLTEDQQSALNRFREKLASDVYVFEDASCCLCGNQDGRLIAQRDRYALTVNTYLCKSCGIMWTNPRMTKDSLAKFYEEDYRPIYVGHAQAPEDFFATQIQHGKIIYNFVASNIKPAQSFTVFDVGCGAGGALVPFVEAGWFAFGCDVGHEYLQRGRSAGLVLEHGDVSSLSKHGRANLVILSHVLEHLPHPLRSLEQIAQVLVDDGYAYVELPGIFSIHRTYGDLLLFLQNAHLYHFTLATLTALMAQAGFRLVKGNEYIRALFQRDRSMSFVSTNDQYHKVLSYLYFAELERILHQLRFVRIARYPVTKIIRYVFGDDLVDNVKGKLGWPRV